MRAYAFAIALALTARWLVLDSFVLPSNAMLPGLLVHDHVFVNKTAFGIRIPFTESWIVRWGSPRRGDVVAYRMPGESREYSLKRIVGLPGDRVRIQNQNLSLNEHFVARTLPRDLKGEFRDLRDVDFPGDAAAGGRSLFIHWEERLGGRNHSVLLRRESPAAEFGPVTVPAGQYFVLGDNRDMSEVGQTTNFVPLANVLGRVSLAWLGCESTLPGLKEMCNPSTIRWGRLFHAVN